MAEAEQTIEQKDNAAMSEPRTLGAATVSPSIQAAAAWSWRLILIAAGVVVLLYLMAKFSLIVVPVAIGVLLAVLLAPIVRFMTGRLRLPKPLSVTVAVVGLVAFVTMLITLAGRAIVEGFADLSEKAVAGFQKALELLAEGPLALDAVRVNALLEDLGSTAEENIDVLLSGAVSVTTTVGQGFAGAIIALFCAFFFLLDGRRIWAWVVGLLPRDARQSVHQAGRRGIVTLSAYTRTQILVAFVDGTGIGLGAAILGVPLAFPLGVLVFVGSFIPFVGAILTGIVAILVALVAKGWVTALIMMGVVLFVQQVESNVLQPFLMGHAVSLHPVAVLLVVTAGTVSAGIAGALFAVPIAAMLNTMLLYFHGHDKFPGLGAEDQLTLRPPGDKPAFGKAQGTFERLNWIPMSFMGSRAVAAAEPQPGPDPAAHEGEPREPGSTSGGGLETP